MYHKQLINRFAFVQGKNFTEFYYYLDNTEALDLFVDHGVNGDDLQWNEVRRNREKRYCDAIDPKRSGDMQGRLLFLKHEAMISRFHAMLELACARSDGLVALSQFQQGPALWSNVEFRKSVAKMENGLSRIQTKLFHIARMLSSR